MTQRAYTYADLERGLNAEFYCGDLDRTLMVRQYLSQLLLTLWDNGEGFSGKRPFGNSGWQQDLAVPLVRCGLLEGVLYGQELENHDPEYDDALEQVYAEGYSQEEYHRLVQMLILELCGLESGAVDPVPPERATPADDIDQYVAGYQYRAAFTHAPNLHERLLIEDALRGWQAAQDEEARGLAFERDLHD